MLFDVRQIKVEAHHVHAVLPCVRVVYDEIVPGQPGGRVLDQNLIPGHASDPPDCGNGRRAFRRVDLCLCLLCSLALVDGKHVLYNAVFFDELGILDLVDQPPFVVDHANHVNDGTGVLFKRALIDTLGVRKLQSRRLPVLVRVLCDLSALGDAQLFAVHVYEIFFERLFIAGFFVRPFYNVIRAFILHNEFFDLILRVGQLPNVDLEIVADAPRDVLRRVLFPSARRGRLQKVVEHIPREEIDCPDLSLALDIYDRTVEQRFFVRFQPDLVRVFYLAR